MTLTQLASKKDLASYSELKHRIREALARGRERTADAVERVKVRTSWEVGKLIFGHILLNRERADYGQQAVKRLSADLEISHTELKYMLEFARTYPISPPAGQLSWAHYRDLLAINEDDDRKTLIKRASRNKWTRPMLRREIRKLKSAKQITVTEPPADTPLIPIKGKLDTYRIVTGEAGPWEGRPLIDTGFSNYEELNPSQAGKFKEGDIVQMVKGNLSTVSGLTGVDLYTYRAYVIEVTDADTIWMLIDLGFGIIKEHLRLRGIDAPEITTRAGQEAKRFVQRELSRHAALGAGHVLITSTKSDKYDRYLADIFYQTKNGEQFLNNKLFEAGLAVRV